MTALRFLTAGESHGRCLIGVIEGLPAGFALTEEDLAPDLKRRMQGYGRGGRMKIEDDSAALLSGVLRGKTTGAPIAVMIENKDWQLQREDKLPPINFPRPGHADLAGLLKYNATDIRAISERTSARETAARVALGAIAKKFLNHFPVKILGFVTEIGGIHVKHGPPKISELYENVESSPLRVPSADQEKEIIALIDQCKLEGDSLGGAFMVIAEGVPAGLGSSFQWDRRLDARLAQALMSIHAIKAVEVGEGVANARRKGSEAHDQIVYENKKFGRLSNHAGGTEGGISNGEPIVAQAYMKPISSIHKVMASVDVVTKKPAKSHYQRSDVCAVPAASVVGEAMMALVLAEAMLEKFGGDSMSEVLQNYDSYNAYLENR